jgi:ferric-dicitrate binding protein FerR (iron transport regulator)
MVAYRSGDKDRAVREQMQAWMSVDPDLKDAYRRELDVYRGTTKRTKRR